MKNYWKLLLLVILVLPGCREEDENIDPTEPVIVQFGEDRTILEGSAALEVPILFSRSASRSGTIVVKITSDHFEAIETNPSLQEGQVALEVGAGNTSANLTVTSVNNTVLDGIKSIHFEIIEASEGFVIGADKTMTVNIIDDEAAVAADFELTEANLIENSEAIQFQVLLAGPAPEAGEIVIELHGLPGDELLTIEPAPQPDGRLILQVDPGATALGIIAIPRNDDLLKGHHTIHLTISEANGGVTKGTALTFSLNLRDDELIGKPHFYETVGGGWRDKRTYSYNETGMLRQIDWETETPGHRTGTYIYYYASNGLIQRVNSHEGYDEYFYQENGRIVRSETINNGVKTSYSEYDYDPAGNPGAQAIYYRQPTGEYKLSSIIIYLHYDHGNIYKQLTYVPVEGEEEPHLIATRTFETYHMDKFNLFPTYEVIPGITSQRNLPASYRHEAGQADLTYNFAYEYNDDGLPVKRYTTGPGGGEVTTYTYY